MPGRCQPHPGLTLPPLLFEDIKTPETLGWWRWWGVGGPAGLSARDEWLRGVTRLAPVPLATNAIGKGSAQTSFQGSPGSPGCHRNPCLAESILKGGAGPRAEFITLYSPGEKKKEEEESPPLCASAFAFSVRGRWSFSGSFLYPQLHPPHPALPSPSPSAAQPWEGPPRPTSPHLLASSLSLSISPNTTKETPKSSLE